MATSPGGVIYTGLRAGGGTQLYTINPATAVTTFVGTVPGVSLSGIVFDTAPAPSLAPGPVKKKTKKSAVRISGTVTGIGTQVAVKGRPAVMTNGSWTVKVKLKKGKNKLAIVATDVFGQSLSTVTKVTRLAN